MCCGLRVHDSKTDGDKLNEFNPRIMFGGNTFPLYWYAQSDTVVQRKKKYEPKTKNIKQFTGKNKNN